MKEYIKLIVVLIGNAVIGLIMPALFEHHEMFYTPWGKVLLVAIVYGFFGWIIVMIRLLKPWNELVSEDIAARTEDSGRRNNR